jgi:hypothetical protein
VKSWVFAVIAILVAVALAWLLWLIAPDEHYRVYDCSLAEFHPDYPPAVREECRKLRHDQKNFI